MRRCLLLVLILKNKKQRQETNKGKGMNKEKEIPQFGIRIVHKKVGSLINILYLYR